MLGPGKLDEAVRGERGLLPGIEACIKALCLVPSLTLIYSAIDVVSALTRPQDKPETNRTFFKDWVKAYMRDFLATTGCSDEDIYAARCGVMHTMTRSSGLSKKGSVKTLVYYWRDGPRPDSTAPPALGSVQICVNDLYDAFVRGLGQFGAAKAKDSTLAEKVEYHEQELLCYRPWSSVKIRVA